MPKKRDPDLGVIEQATVLDALYEGWDQDVADEGRRIIKQVRRRTEAFIIDTGRDLIAFKSKLEHGQFVAWVENGLGLTARTAQNYMAAAAAFGGKSETVSYLPPATIYKLAVAPEPIRVSVLERIEAGNTPTSDEILNEVRVAREQDRERRELEREKARLARLSPREQANEKARGRRASARVRDEEAERDAYRTEREDDAALLREACAILLEAFGADRLAAFTGQFRGVRGSIMDQAERAAQAELAKSEPVFELDVSSVSKLRLGPSLAERKRIEAIAEHIKSIGHYDPLQVKKDDVGDYVILDGWRRFQAIVNVLGHSKIRGQIAPILKGKPDHEQTAAQVACPDADGSSAEM